MVKKFIINADDFGLQSSVNNAIVELLTKKVINSTTLMANMPGFDEAVKLAHNNNITAKIGVHLTLTDGEPLTSNRFIKELYANSNCKDYSGLKNFKQKLFFLSKKEKEIIYNEFAAQVTKIRKAGIDISHVDTHHHTHEVWSVTQILFLLLREYKIPSMRILNNLNQSTSFYKKGYRKLINKIIKTKAVNYSCYFGNQLETIAQLNTDRNFFDRQSLEMMVHPVYNNSGIIVDRIKDRELDFNYPESLKNLIGNHANDFYL